MAIPDGIATVVVTGRFLYPDGRPIDDGTLTFSAPALLTLPGEDSFVNGSAQVAFTKGTSDGTFSVTLVATDIAGRQPADWRYQVTESFAGLPTRTYWVDLPQANPLVNLADIAPADPTQGDYVPVIGPAGPPGTSVRSGHGAPNAAVGNDGDFYLDLDLYVMYGPKAAAAWPTPGTALGGGGAVSSVNDQQGAVQLNAASVGALPEARVTVAELIAQAPPFYIAHRGSGGEYPEHTMAAYEAAVSAGAKAIEVSVRRTKDGHLVCFHDTDLARVADISGKGVADYTYAALSQLVRVKGSKYLGAGWADQPIPRLRDVLDRFLGRVVIFLEGKSSDSIVPLQNLAKSYPGATKSVVWKGYYTSDSFPWAKANGFTTWGYVDPGTTDAELNAADANGRIDMWGVPHTMPDARIQDVVNRGKTVICWEVHRRSDVTRLSSLGVKGMMCSQLVYVTGSGPIGTKDNFADRVKAPGDMGPDPYNPTYALQYGTDSDAYLNVMPNQAALIGSVSRPTPPSTYTIRFQLMFEGVPAATQHAGFAFCKPDDTKYGFGAANKSGGYHVVFRGNGDMQLYSHAAGVTSGTSLGSVATLAPAAGQWVPFEITVTPTDITLRRTDMDPAPAVVSTNTTYRGGYVHVSTGSVDALANKPHWRGIEIL